MNIMGGGDDIEALRGMLAAGKMEPYLRHIRFPRFRNLAEGLRIDFTFPVTALVGVNGTNKTAILRALEGSPDYMNIGLKWFSTAVDPIEDAKGDRRIRFIHGWNPRSVGATVEAIKQREPSSEDPDYFEPAKPRPRDGMEPMPDGIGERNEGRGPSGRNERSADRWNPIPKHVEYIDFRSELSAYDKYFFHNRYRRRSKDPATLPAEERSRKTLIRDRSVHLQRALRLAKRSNRLGGRERIYTPRTPLPPNEVTWIGKILGRSYSSIDLIEHSFFEVRGWTALLRSNYHRYSEAFAGSGEFAVVRVVHRILNTPDGSLVLLDEPEVSLHPGAQSQLIRFILQMAKEKHLQFVFSTHSPELIKPLPHDAIKVLQLRPDDGRVELRAQESLPQEAFVVVGHEFEKPTIVVEDRLAAEIVRHALRVHHADLLLAVEIKDHPGGCSDIKAVAIANWALTDQTNILVMLDGDQRVTGLEPSQHLAGQKLTEHIRALTGLTPRLARSSGEPVEGAERRYATWWEKNVRHLPEVEPEGLLLSMVGDSSGADDPKTVWVERTFDEMPQVRGKESVTSDEIFYTQQRALTLIPADDPSLRSIADTVFGWLGAQG